jgi:hypothetical protein
MPAQVDPWPSAVQAKLTFSAILLVSLALVL